LNKEDGFLICPITKSPHSQGRVGPEKYQDWYRICAITARLASRLPNSEVLIISAFRFKNGASEIEIYRAALNKMGVKNPIILEKGLETTEQVEIAVSEAEKRNKQAIIVSSFLHYPRIRWISRKEKALHRMVVGIPRPKEAITDIILIFVFPIIDLLGWRGKFKQKLEKRRKKGKL